MVLGNGKSKRWIHSPDSLINGKVSYNVKFLGKAEVPEPRGMPMVKAALQKLSFSRQLKRTEGTKPPKVELEININSVSINDVKTKETWHNIALHRVSFCADDKTDKRLFAFIAKLDDNKHYCYGLDSLHQANDITLTIGQAFELAYDKFVKENPSTQGGKKVVEMSKRIQELENENNKLRKKIAELEAASGRSHHESAGTSSPPTNQVAIEPNPLDQSFSFDTPRSAFRRSSSPQSTAFSSPETIVNPTAVFPISSGFSFQSLPNASSGLPSRFAQSSVIDGDSAKDIYAIVDRGTRLPHDEHSASKTVAFDTLVERQPVKRVRKISSRKKKKLSSEERLKNTLASLLPGNLLGKKSKRTQRGHAKESPEFEDLSTPSSSQSSGTYASLDDVIATLQKLMTRDDQNQRPVGESSRENVTSRRDRDRFNCHVPVKEPSKIRQDVTFSSASCSQALENRLEASYLLSDPFNSNDDVTSISSATTDSSSQEYSYVLQPSGVDGSKQSRNRGPFSKCFTRNQYRSAVGSPSPTNIYATLRHLSGEDGYMVLAGGSNQRDSAHKRPAMQFNVDSTYDNVNRLMEAFRHAAAKDAALSGSVRPTSPTTMPSKPTSRMKRRSATSWASSTEKTPLHAQSTVKTPEKASVSPNCSSFPVCSCADVTCDLARPSSPKCDESNEQGFPTRPSLRKHEPRRQYDLLNCRETDLIYCEDRMTSRRTTDLRPPSQDAFNMQPFVPKLPQPPSRSPRQIKSETTPPDPFNAVNFSTINVKGIMDMQNAFSQGGAVSDDNLTLDSFDPLKH